MRGMMRSKGFLVLMALVLSVGLVSCSGKKEAEEPKKTISEVEEENNAEEAVDPGEIALSEWNGKWNSVLLFLDAEETTEALEEERGDVPFDEFKAEKVEGLECFFSSCKVDGDTVEFFEDGLESTSLGKTDFEFVKNIPLEHAGKTFYWHVYEAEDKDIIGKYLVLMEIHGEDTMAHFHLRYGDDIDELMAKEDWWPTFVAPDAPIDRIADEIAE